MSDPNANIRRIALKLCGSRAAEHIYGVTEQSLELAQLVKNVVDANRAMYRSGDEKGAFALDEQAFASCAIRRASPNGRRTTRAEGIDRYRVCVAYLGKGPARFLRASLDSAVPKEAGAGQGLRPATDHVVTSEDRDGLRRGTIGLERSGNANYRSLIRACQSPSARRRSKTH